MTEPLACSVLFRDYPVDLAIWFSFFGSGQNYPHSKDISLTPLTPHPTPSLLPSLVIHCRQLLFSVDAKSMLCR